MKRMLVVELYLPGYVPEAPNSGSLRRWLGLEASLFDVAAMKKLFGQLVQGYVLTGLEYCDGAVTTDEQLFIGQISESSYMKDASFIQEAVLRLILKDDLALAQFEEAMSAKYQKTDEHPVCALEVWRSQVGSGATRLSYWGWVCEEVERLNKPGVAIDARLIVVRQVLRKTT